MAELSLKYSKSHQESESHCFGVPFWTSSSGPVGYAAKLKEHIYSGGEALIQGDASLRSYTTYLRVAVSHRKAIEEQECKDVIGHTNQK